MTEIHIPELTIEPCEDGTLLLVQDAGGNVDRVQVHPLHIRLIAERFGLASSSDPTAIRTIATLQRRVLLIRQQVNQLYEWLHEETGAEGARIEELTLCSSIRAMLNEFVADFGADVSPRVQPPSCGPASPPKPLAMPKRETPESEPQQLTL